jgi:hypothetical protein
MAAQLESDTLGEMPEADVGFRTAAELLKQLDGCVLMQAHAHCDVVMLMSILAKLFQSQDIDPQMMSRAIESTITTLTNMYMGGPEKPMKWGAQMSALLGTLKDGDKLDEITDDRPSEFVLGVHRIAVTALMVRDQYVFAARLAKSVIVNLERRFPDNALVGAFTIFSPESIGDETFDVEENIKLLLNFYAPEVDADDDDQGAPFVSAAGFRAQWPMVAAEIALLKGKGVSISKAITHIANKFASTAVDVVPVAQARRASPM